MVLVDWTGTTPDAKRYKDIIIRDDRMNMYRLKDKLRFSTVLAIVLIVAVAPYLQAYQASYVSERQADSCCGDCRCGHGEGPVDQTPAAESSCGCAVSTPATQADIPFEAQVRPTVKLVTYAAETSAISLITVTEIDRYLTAPACLPSAHGPPLYIRNASYLI